METISTEDTRVILNDPALVRPVIKVASRTPHMSRYAGLNIDEPLSLRAVRQFGLSWISLWFTQPSSHPSLSTEPAPVQLSSPVGDIHHVKLLQLQAIKGSTRIHRVHDNGIIGVKFSVSTGVLYTQDERLKVREYSVEKESQAYALLKGPGLRLNFL